MTPPAPTSRSASELAEERDYLLRSIEDLERERAAGDVDDDDYAALRASYVERAAATLREIAAGAPADERPSDATSWTAAPGSRSQRLRRLLGRRTTRRILVPVGLVCALGLVLVVAAHAAGVRLPGESATGSVTLSSAAEVRQELDQASILATGGQLSQAIATYDTILAQAPHQPEALADKGWLVRLAGIAEHSSAAVADGDVILEEAVRAAPGYAEARAFYGVALVQDESDARGALLQFRAFLGDHPSSGLLSSVGPQAARVFVEEGAAVPPALRRFEPRPAPSSKG